MLVVQLPVYLFNYPFPPDLRLGAELLLELVLEVVAPCLTVSC